MSTTAQFGIEQLNDLARKLGVSCESLAALGVHRNGSAWRIPERDAHGNITGHALRQDNGKKSCEPGSRRGLTFTYPFPAGAGLDASEPIVIVEGMSDVAAAHDLGFVAVGRPSATGGVDHLRELVADRHIVFVTENDPSGIGRKSVEKIARDLFGVAASIRIVDPPASVKDLREWLTAPAPVTADELARLIARTPPFMPSGAETPSQADRDLAGWQIESAPAVLQSADEAVEWLGPIPGLFTRGCSTLLSALPKAGKTTFVAAMIADFDAAGLKVLIVTEESRKHWRQRIARHTYSDRVAFIFRPFKGRPASQQWVAFIGFVCKAGADVVIIDTLANLWPCMEENSPDKAIPALAPLGQILDQNAALILLHHAGKSEKGQGMAGRGSNSIQAWVDVVLELRRTNPEAPEDGQRTINGWGRWDEIPDELVLQRDEEAFRVIGSVKEAKGHKRLRIIQEILEQRGESSWLTAEGILAEWPEESRAPGQRTLETDLVAGWRLDYWRRQGKGVRNDPFMYSRRTNSARIDDGSGPIYSRSPLESDSARNETEVFPATAQIPATEILRDYTGDDCDDDRELEVIT